MVDWPMPDIGSEEAVVSPTAGDLALANAAVILIGLKKVSSVSGVPFLSDAANIALRLVNLVKDVRDNNDAFRLLGLQAGRLVWTIGIECRRIMESGGSVPRNIIENINGLLTNLHSIETFVEGKMVRRKLKRFIEHNSDKLEVARYRDELRNALDQFAIQAGIASQQALHSINTTLQEHRVEVIFDRIHQTDTLNRLMQQQSEQMEVLHMAITNRYAEEDRMRETKEYHARVEMEQAASKAAEREYQERLEAEKRREQEKKRKQAEAEAERKRKEAEDELQRYDDAQKAKREARKRKEQAEEEERETREAIAVVEMLEAERLRKQKAKEQEQQRKKDQEDRRKKREQEEEDARLAAEEAEKERKEARRRKQRREEENANATLTKTEVEITYTRKAKKSDPGPGPTTGKGSKAKANSSARYKEVSREEFDRQVHRAFGHMGDSDDDDDFDWDSSDSSDDDDEYWSDEAPKKRRGVSKGKQSTKAKAVARASSSRPFVDANSLSAGIHDMVMQRVNASVGGSAPFQRFRSPSPYMMPPPAPHRSRPASFAGSSSQANAVSISMNNVSNSAISFGDYPAVVRNSGNVSVVNISNVGNRY